VGGEPTGEALVDPLDRIDREKPVRDEQPERNRQDGQNDVPGDDRDQEGDNRMSVAQQVEKTLCRAAFARFEQRRVVGIGDRLPIDGLALDHVRERAGEPAFYLDCHGLPP